MLSVLSLIIQIFLKLWVQRVVCDWWRVRQPERVVEFVFWVQAERHLLPDLPHCLLIVFPRFLAHSCPGNRTICTMKNWKGLALSQCLWRQKSLPLCLGITQSLSKVAPDKVNWWEAESSSVPIHIWNSRNVVSVCSTLLERAATVGNVAEFVKLMKGYIEFRWCTALSFHVLVKE